MNGEQLIIRTFATGDQEEAQLLILNGLAEHFNQLDPSLNPDLAEIAGSYPKVGDLFLVAELNGRIVGTGALVRESLDTGRIVRVSVASDQRRKGIGQKIVNCLLDKARELAMSCILVETNLDWPEAIAFYRILGFSEYDRDLERTYLFLQI